jgi:eukaryotic-like serine/threonine-protein kinase
LSTKFSRDEITKPGRTLTTGEESSVSLTPLPDPQRISEVRVSTVDGELDPPVNPPADPPSDLSFDSDPEASTTTERHQPLDRKRQHTDELDTGVWEGHRPPKHTPGNTQQIIADRYRVQERIAHGGMARIYKVRHLNLGKIFALKVVDRQSDAAKRMEQLFFREAKIASVMDHPNVVQVTDFGFDDDLGAYIVMEYLKGETLHTRLNRELTLHQSLSISSALEIGIQTAEALHYMHSQNVIHCDIKSENVFLCKHQSEHRQRTLVKLIDFGLSRSTSSDLQLARAEVAGTPEYMAPELIRGRAPQPSMDIYSLGVLFYEMLTGRLPFTGSMREVINDQLYTAAPSPSEALTEPLDERVEGFIMRALSKDPIARHESMGRVIFELRTLMEMLNLRDGHPTRTKPDRSSSESGGAHYRGFFDQCPFPMFQLDRKAHIIAANRAFRQFVGIKKREMTGQLIDSTRLAYVYPNIASDLSAAVQRRHKKPIQRVLSFTQPDGKRIPMMSWLTPEADDTGRIIRFYGYVHPLGD